jgi:hypothetical protein
VGGGVHYGAGAAIGHGYSGYSGVGHGTVNFGSGHSYGYGGYGGYGHGYYGGYSHSYYGYGHGYYYYGYPHYFGGFSPWYYSSASYYYYPAYPAYGYVTATDTNAYAPDYGYSTEPGAAAARQLETSAPGGRPLPDGQLIPRVELPTQEAPEALPEEAKGTKQP